MNSKKLLIKLSLGNILWVNILGTIDDKIENNEKKIRNLEQIAINKIKKYYSLVMRIRDISLFDKSNNELEIIDKIDSSFDIESLLIKDEEWKSRWDFIKNKKNQDIPKVFYLYYKEEMTIKEISKRWV